MCIHVCHSTHVEVRNLLLRVNSLLPCGFCHRTQVTRPGSKHLDVLSHLISLRMFSKCFASLPHSISSMFWVFLVRVLTLSNNLKVGFSIWPRLTLNSLSLSLSLLNVGITGFHHHSWLEHFFCSWCYLIWWHILLYGVRSLKKNIFTVLLNFLWMQMFVCKGVINKCSENQH